MFFFQLYCLFKKKVDSSLWIQTYQWIGYIDKITWVCKPHFDYKEIHSNQLRSHGHNFRLYDCKDRCLNNFHCTRIYTQFQKIPMNKLHAKQEQCFGETFCVLLIFHLLPYYHFILCHYSIERNAKYDN